MVIRDLTISRPLPSRFRTDGLCHECGNALLVGYSINNVGQLVSRDDFSCVLTLGVEFFSQVTPMRFPSGIEAVSQVSVGRSYHPMQRYVIQATPSTDVATVDVIFLPGVLDADGELGASLLGP